MHVLISETGPAHREIGRFRALCSAVRGSMAMRTSAYFRKAGWALAVVWCYSVFPIHASPPVFPPTANTSAIESLPGDPDLVLRRALELERSRNWTGAIEVYDKAVKSWPGRNDFSHRLRLCETHYRIIRRYQDQSFRNVLLKLPQERALGLYDELLERIETHYVDAVPFEPLIRRGLDNLEVALRDPNFLRVNAGNVAPGRITWLRDALRLQRGRLRVPDRAAANAQVLVVCDLARKALAIVETAVILEFTYGACDALDDYSSYLTPDKLDDLYAMIDGNFVGLGIELKLDGDVLKLVGVIKGGPAHDAGLKLGDQLTHVAGAPIQGLSLDEAANRLQGTEGSPIDLVVKHPDGLSDSYRIVRRHVEVESVANVKIIDAETSAGYVQLNGFQKSSTEELDKAVTALRRQGMKALILDLRGNPGGLLNVAVEMADRFIEQGIIVSTRGRAPGQSQVYRASQRADWKMPVYVLIDRDSASASEILAGALKDHRRATILGERSYGKGSVQSIFALKNAPAGLKLTTAKFYSPKNRPYSEQGVEPDVLVTTSAKPVGGKAPAVDSSTFGDPAVDVVLQYALKEVRGESRPSR